MKRWYFLGLLLRPWNKLDTKSPVNVAGQPESPFCFKVENKNNQFNTIFVICFVHYLINVVLQLNAQRQCVI
jgi:hypothetical protein